MPPNDADGNTNIEDPDQSAPLGAVYPDQTAPLDCLSRPIC